jgi:hypothetical protein
MLVSLFLAVNFFGLVEPNNDCVVDLTDCSFPTSRTVKRSRGCEEVTKPKVTITKSSSECKKMTYEVHFENKPFYSWGKMCQRKYRTCRGKVSTQSPTPCHVDQVTGGWKRTRDRITQEQSSETRITIGTETTSGTATTSEWSSSISAKMSMGFDIPGFGTSITATMGSRMAEENSVTIGQTSTEENAITVVYSKEMLGKSEWKFVVNSEGTCNSKQTTTETSFPYMAYTNGPDLKPCCFPGRQADAHTYNSRVCDHKDYVINDAPYCTFAGKATTKPFETAKSALAFCSWELDIIPSEPRDPNWELLSADCSLTPAEVGALKAYSFRCSRCPTPCSMKNMYARCGESAFDEGPKKLTFGSSVCCCPEDYQTDCSMTTALADPDDVVYPDDVALSSAQSASIALFSGSVVVFILQLLL